MSTDPAPRHLCGILLATKFTGAHCWLHLGDPSPGVKVEQDTLRILDATWTPPAGSTVWTDNDGMVRIAEPIGRGFLRYRRAGFSDLVEEATA